MSVAFKKSPELDKNIKRLKELHKQFDKNGGVMVGLPKNSNPYPDGTSVIMVGIAHEFGIPSRNIPERSYLRSTIRQNRAKYKKIVRRLSEKILFGSLDVELAMKQLGMIVATDVKTKIVDIKTPPLAPATIAARKKNSDNPLNDTGHLKKSITFIVKGARSRGN